MIFPLHIVFTGGGTGGHLFPGLAVADQLTRLTPGVRITFVGSGKPLERQQAAAAGYEHFALPCQPLPRRVRDAIPFIIRNAAGYFVASRFLRHEQVAAVIGLGGYASAAMGRAAGRHRLPLILLEQNTVPGRVNRWLAPCASLICTSFDETTSYFDCRTPVRVTGNPIRPQRTPHAPREADPAAPKQLLILGGSGGARALNQDVPRALSRLGPALAGWRILHQSGESGLADTRDHYRQLSLPATVEAFFPDLPRILAETELVVCRSGGTTLAELAAAGVPAILLPYPHAADDHQLRNARVFARAAAAVLLDEREPSWLLDDRLAAAIAGLVGDGRRRAVMSAAMLRLARPHAAAEVAEIIWSIIPGEATRACSRVAA